jgi:hypothetical protein
MQTIDTRGGHGRVLAFPSMNTHVRNALSGDAVVGRRDSHHDRIGKLFTCDYRSFHFTSQFTLS